MDPKLNDFVPERSPSFQRGLPQTRAYRPQIIVSSHRWHIIREFNEIIVVEMQETLLHKGQGNIRRESLHIDIYPVDPDCPSFLSACWHVQSGTRTAPLRFVPDGHQEIYFDLLSKQIRVNLDWTAPVIHKPKKGVDILIVRFAPYGLTLASSSWGSRRKQAFDLPRHLSSIAFGRATLESKIAGITEVLETNHARSQNLPAAVADMVTMITKEKGLGPLESFYSRLSLSKRRLQLVFMAATGLSPKAYARMIRLREAVKEKKMHPEKSLTNIAYEYDYADQSHFIRDCKSLTGLTPREYVSRLQSNQYTVIPS